MFRPDDAIWATAARLVDDGYCPVVVVNAASPADADRAQALGATKVLIHADNVGLAAALSDGITAALAMGADYIMLLDQDSAPPAALGTALISRAEAFVAGGGRLGAIGPQPVDRKRVAAQTTRPGDAVAPGLHRVGSLISSGTVIPRAAAMAVGPMWDALFIDGIDHEWCLRAQWRGYEVLLATDCPMPHDMGDAGFALFGRYKPVHRSPMRHYHIVRNALWLARLSFIPRRWRLLEVTKLALRAPAYLAFSSDRRATLKLLIRAIQDGISDPAPGLHSRALAAESVSTT